VSAIACYCTTGQRCAASCRDSVASPHTVCR
jgi:hypothetical protein